MADEILKADQNFRRVVGGISDDSSQDILMFRLDPTTKRLKVDAVISSGGASGTQYTEGDTDASITGTAIMWEDSSDTLRAVSMAKSLPVQPGTSVAFPITDNGGSITVDGTVDTELTTADLDTGVGTDTRAVVGLIFGANGGATLVSTTNPLPIGDNDGSITVDGAVSLTQGGNTASVDSNNRLSVKINNEADGSVLGKAYIADPTNSRRLDFRNADYDTGGGTVETSMLGIALPASGGPVAGGTSSNPIRTDPTGTTTQPVSVASALPTGTNAIGRTGHDITGIGHGVKTVTTAGTDEALAASTACKRVLIQAQTDNTGLIAVGASGVDATVATGTGILLNAGDIFELEIDNLNDVYIDSTVNGDGVRYTYFT